jgi:HD superfamily phosphodiesterase
MDNYPPSVCAALAFVCARLDAAVDASHDIEHIRRVVGMTARLAGAEGFDAERSETALLCAAYHDVADHKYVKSEKEGQEALRAALDHLVGGAHITAERAER